MTLFKLQYFNIFIKKTNRIFSSPPFLSALGPEVKNLPYVNSPIFFIKYGGGIGE